MFDAAPRYQSQHFPLGSTWRGGFFLANIFVTSVLAYWLWPHIYVFVFASLGILMGLTNAIPMSLMMAKKLTFIEQK